MKATEPGRIVPADEAAIASDESDYALSIAGVYQDRLTRAWALHTCLSASRLAGEGRIQNTWYEVHRLSDPDILLEAVHAVLRADVIVVSIHATDELPIELCAWIDAWLPRRLSRAGALAALIGVAGRPDSRAVRTQEYLQTVACRGELDFVPHQRTLPDAFSFAGQS
jgi:hypothetical protein